LGCVQQIKIRVAYNILICLKIVDAVQLELQNCYLRTIEVTSQACEQIFLSHAFPESQGSWHFAVYDWNKSVIDLQLFTNAVAELPI